MDFNIFEVFTCRPYVTILSIILMVIVPTIYLIIYGKRPVKTQFITLFLLNALSLVFFILDCPLYYFLGSEFSGFGFILFYSAILSASYIQCSIVAFIKSILHFKRFQTNYSIFLVFNSLFSVLLALLNILFLNVNLDLPFNAILSIIFLFFVISGFAQFIIGLKENKKVESILQNQGKTL